MNEGFYSSIRPVDSFEALASGANYTPIPADWYLVAADVMNSTAAIAQGNYKAVNTVGVSVIAATVNALRPVELPYVFGGDGAILCIPEWGAAKVRSVIAATLAMAERSFGLQLRAAIIPATFLRDRGHEILVARHRVSEHYIQTAFFGEGPGFAESALKGGQLPPSHLVMADESAEADYSGLECRWQEIPSPGGETVAIIVKATEESGRSLSVYRQIMKTIGEIYGDTDRCRPVTEEKVRAAYSKRILAHEVGVHFWRRSAARQALRRVKLRSVVLLGWFLMKFRLMFNGADWGRYKRDLVSNTDFRKFDGSLRLVLSGNREQRGQLELYLNNLKNDSLIRYGIHVSDSAIITCLVEQRQSVHFHFVDASGGGYSAAAKKMKE